MDYHLEKETPSEKEHEQKILKKDMLVIIKENQKLQSELKNKNKIISSLINENFGELKSLQEKHENIIESLKTSYESNIKKIHDVHKLFKKSLRSSLKNNINTHYKITNDNVNILTNQNDCLNQKIDTLNKFNNDKNNTIKNLEEKYNDVTKNNCDLQIKCSNLENLNHVLDQELQNLKLLHERQMFLKNEEGLELGKITSENESLQENVKLLKQQVLKFEEICKNQNLELENTKCVYKEIHQKHFLILNDNISKQTSIDEKTLEILSLNSKTNEMEKIIMNLETNKKELNVKLNELELKNENLHSELTSLNKVRTQLEMEKNMILDEQEYISRELEQYKQKYLDLETFLLDKIEKIQNECHREKESCISKKDVKIKELKDEHEKKLASLSYDYNSIITEKEKQIDGLTNHLKSFNENLYVTLNELEKLKLLNGKLKMDQLNIDQRIGEISGQFKKEIEELKMTHKKEKDILLESYNETIKKSQELSDMLQNRLKQTVEALSLSKEALSNLKETNQNLERQIQMKESDQNVNYEKINQIKNENISLREKLDRSIELNNAYNIKEKQYESQIKQSNAKYNQLVMQIRNNNNK